MAEIVNAPIRKWTETEIDETIDFVKTEQPGLWDEILRREKALEALSDHSVDDLMRLILKKYPNTPALDRGALTNAIRMRLHKQFHAKRIWTEAEIDAAIAFVEQRDSVVMEELAELERRAEGPEPLEKGSVTSRMLLYMSQLHPECRSFDQINLFDAIRERVLRQIRSEGK